MLTGGLIKGKLIINWLFVGSQGFSEVGNFVCIGLGFSFMVDQLGYKNTCLWKNGIGERYGHICEEVNEAKNIGLAISLIISFLNYFYLTKFWVAEIQIFWD